jgi:hypothetical protein
MGELMRLVVRSGPGVVELSYTWLPLFAGTDVHLKKDIEDKLCPQMVGKELTDEVLDWAHEQVVGIICARYRIKGLRDYLDAVKFVEGPET